ncbi:2-dehydro-3-deoxyphosphogluconate aldolase [Ureibacillus massiliensis 4400831 = CIP 108448 = CCUG 49529]|uniref:2-dehydro-3-deoxyphosphogluconate aldolase n=1 Tax=Ureibacillus massiliensis 4400831 = CIP 108448 = CCUG 49529 TaxID=1211035 RepID=A0A0A3J7E4_9BACL|nr:bifunctional 4-hydroxy-2-oxoglutarate aldolase/2-dehydro-3-deoxy-phosphogluconate aldolase [Ureibacillus massiliensis]KGR91113.1 2-dehydro-3-deoxyphosphogluconate aldolase [Ureibacillus massiliensis 4400831 = CIP 108448 = CCUG 49529]
MYKWDRLKFIVQNGVVAVIRKVNPSIIEESIEALIEGGIKVLEITVDSEVSFNVIRKLKTKYGEDVLVGAGTVLDKITAKTAIEAKADFIFSPIYDIETIQLTNRYGCISIPGVYTPTEISQAYSAGADILKVFPATSLGPNYFKDVSGPLPHVPLMPTGGVSLENMAEFLNNGAVAVGVGSALLNKEYLANKQFDQIQLIAKQYIDKFREVKK